MNNFKSLLFTLLLITTAPQLFAHALWIETNTAGKIGQSQEVKVYYGEYVNNEREETAKWFSDVKSFSLWLTAPGKEKIKLNTIEGSNFYAAKFTPEKDGVYFLTVLHEAKELGGTTKYEFSSIATITVGKVSLIDFTYISNGLKVSVNEAKTYQTNATVKIKAELNGKPLANKHISVFSPEGWAKEYTTDQNGNVEFKPIWPGRYVLEVSNYEKTTGEHYGKTYSAAWQGATSSFEVSK